MKTPTARSTKGRAWEAAEDDTSSPVLGLNVEALSSKECSRRSNCAHPLSSGRRIQARRGSPELCGGGSGSW
ncbi:hypothetical protein M6B38_217975 [Iris pallida]|uniref:Uncharacterized protein n=1 Tax=Iris pallida TaxID=29817 RepID=A0AAX6E0P1_IRIPA|nr:hypothetical protein M6B38_217975 [Iris pallida]